MSEAQAKATGRLQAEIATLRSAAQERTGGSSGSRHRSRSPRTQEIIDGHDDSRALVALRLVQKTASVHSVVEDALRGDLIKARNQHAEDQAEIAKLKAGDGLMRDIHFARWKRSHVFHYRENALLTESESRAAHEMSKIVHEAELLDRWGEATVNLFHEDLSQRSHDMCSHFLGYPSRYVRVPWTAANRFDPTA